MAYGDPITDSQIDYIISLGRGLIEDQTGEQPNRAETEEELNLMVKPVYDCEIRSFNRGQAAMLIETLKWETGESDDEPPHQSII